MSQPEYSGTLPPPPITSSPLGIDAIPLTTYSSFLKRPSSPNIPIQAIGLSLYESLPSRGDPYERVEAPGTKVTRTQWLDLSTLEMSSLVGKNILIVDEVDDTRTTLEYAVKELQKDVEAARRNMPGGGGDTRFSIFVLHVGFRSTRLSCSLLIYCLISFRIFPTPFLLPRNTLDPDENDSRTSTARLTACPQILTEQRQAQKRQSPPRHDHRWPLSSRQNRL